jgi:hypothetical protein
MFKRKIKVTLNQGQALQVSLFLEQLRINNPDYDYKKEVRLMEDVIDAQLWGKEYVEGRRQPWN